MQAENINVESLKKYIQNQIDESIKNYIEQYNLNKEVLKPSIVNECEVKDIKYGPNSNIHKDIHKDNTFNINNLKDVKLGPFTDYDNYNSLVKEKLGPNENELYGQKEIKSSEQMRREDIWNLDYLKKVSEGMKKLLEQEYNHYYGDVKSYIADENKLFNNFINHLTEEDLVMLVDNINIILPSDIKLQIQWVVDSIPKKWQNPENTNMYDICRNAYYDIVKIILKYKYSEIIEIPKPDDDTYFEQMLIAEFNQNIDIITEIIIKKYNRELFDYLFEKTYYMVDDGKR